jgi:hypothetical protein
MANVPGEDTSTWFQGKAVQNAFPTWTFLFTELSHGEDVEIGLQDAGGPLHVLTLTGARFRDLNIDGTFEPGEPQFIDYLDPNNPTQLFEVPLIENPFGNDALAFNWVNGGANTPEDVFINFAYSESVPAPTSLTLVILGALVGALYQWHLDMRRRAGSILASPTAGR